MADGQWTTEQQNEVATWCEQLRLLRWTFGIDAELMRLLNCLSQSNGTTAR
jgi:hypothetical protein